MTDIEKLSRIAKCGLKLTQYSLKLREHLPNESYVLWLLSDRIGRALRGDITSQEVYMLYRDLLLMLMHVSRLIVQIGDHERLNYLLSLRQALEECLDVFRENADLVIEGSLTG